MENQKTWAFNVCNGSAAERNTHHLIVVLSLIESAGIREEQHLRVGMDRDVKLHRVLVGPQEVSHTLSLRLGFRERSTVDLTARLIRGSLRFEKKEAI